MVFYVDMTWQKEIFLLTTLSVGPQYLLSDNHKDTL